MRDHRGDHLRLDELIEELTEIRREHGDMFTNICPVDLRIDVRRGPKELRITAKS